MNFQEKIEIYKDIIVSLDYCVNDYLYILDVENDEYFISPHATVRFKMDNAYFKNPVKEFKKFVYYKDYDLVVEDLNKILSGEKTYHNMQYRWLNDESLPVWINCRGRAIIENHQVKYLIGCINEKLYHIVSDEFIIFDSNGTVDDAIYLYKKIQERTLDFIESTNYEIYYTFSAGILDFYSHPTASYIEIMKWTEFSLNNAKESGKNTYDIFDNCDYQKFQRESAIIRYLHQSIDHDYEGFDVYFQPIVDVNKKEVTHLETLLRFKCDEFGRISPMEFIPLLEKSGLIIPVGKWVLEKAIQACLSLKKYQSQLKVNVNISYVQVLKSAILNDILSIMKKYNVDRNRLVIELTESGFIESDRSFVNFCNQLKENSILLALDDFGTGYSNFHYLYNLKPDCIKVDRGLMKNALSNDYENLLLKHMIDMAHSVGVNMCIEGIETEEELHKVLEMGSDFIQGFYYSKPLPFNEITDYLKNFKKII